jgi:hypothetical protein
MVKTTFGLVVIGVWIAVIAILTAASVALRAHFSTTALLVGFGVAPGILIVLLANGAPSPTVAQILHALETPERRDVR